MKEKEIVDITDVIDVPKEYYSISIPKLEITQQIKNALDEQNLSIRKLGKEIGMKHNQIIRVTSSQSYHIDTLLKIIDGLGLELVVRPKRK
jgi:HTH-type transcriptional regulator / antitoxin HipB